MKNYRIELNFEAMISILFFAFLITDAFNMVGEYASCEPFTSWGIVQVLATLVIIFLLGVRSKIKINRIKD